jgi:hypothetical protein
MIFPRKTKKVGKCVAMISLGEAKPICPKTRYVVLRFKKEKWSAHRLSFSINKKAIPRSPVKGRWNWRSHSGMICHHCDNKWCINPSHLYLGDHKTNGRDYGQRMTLKQRRDKSLKSKETQASPEFRKRMSKILSAVPRTKIWKDRIQAASLRRAPPNIITRKKMSLSAKRRCANMGKRAMAKKMEHVRSVRLAKYK